MKYIKLAHQLYWNQFLKVLAKMQLLWKLIPETKICGRKRLAKGIQRPYFGRHYIMKLMRERKHTLTVFRQVSIWPIRPWPHLRIVYWNWEKMNGLLQQRWTVLRVIYEIRWRWMNDNILIILNKLFRIIRTSKDEAP